MLFAFSPSIVNAKINIPEGDPSIPGINPSNKLTALSSCVSLCARWGNDSSVDHTKDFYKVYLFAKDINNTSNLTFNEIIAFAINRGLRVNSAFIPQLSCTSVIITKEYDYESNDLYIYRNSCFDDDLEKFKIKVRYTVLQDSEGPILGLGTNPILDVCAYGITNPINPVATFVDTYGSFVRYFNINQEEYGYKSSYIPKLSFEYYSEAVKENVRFTLIDSDKIVLINSLKTLYITKEQHYQRNYYTEYFRTGLLLEYFSQYIMSNFNAYFHKLGEYDQDTSNKGNYKILWQTCAVYGDEFSLNLSSYFPDSTYELVFNSKEEIVQSDLVMGTFNFYTPTASLTSVSTKLHYLYDVYPYLLWGNSILDNSCFKERILWDYNSFKVLDIFNGCSSTMNLQTFRGEFFYKNGFCPIEVDLVTAISNQLMLGY